MDDKKNAAHLNFYFDREAPFRIPKRPKIEEYGYFELCSFLPDIKCAYLHCDEIYGHFFLKK